MRIMIPCLQVLYRFAVAHPPVYSIAIVGKYLGNSCSPATVADNSYSAQNLITCQCYNVLMKKLPDPYSRQFITMLLRAQCQVLISANAYVEQQQQN